MKKVLLAAVVAFASCRTEIKPIVKPTPVKKQRQAGQQCEVHDYAMATDVPSGSQNIGWVKVPMQESDEKTFEKLREEVCAKGGDAMSQMHWLRPSGSSVADTPTELEGNAWVLP